MKRIAYAITGLLALALLVTGMTPVRAWTTPSTACDDGVGTEVEILDDPAVPLYVAVDVDLTYATVCYRDRSGLTNAAGFIHVSYQAPNDKIVLWCAGELPAAVAVSCLSYADLDVVTDPNPSSLGAAVSGWVKVEGVTGTIPLTGVEVGGVGTGTTDGTSANSTGTCAWVLGMQILGSCGGALADARLVYEPVPVVTTTSLPVCAGVYTTTCTGAWVTATYVDNAYFYGDGGPTATVTVLDDNYSTPDEHQPGCIGFESDDNPRCGVE